MRKLCLLLCIGATISLHSSGQTGHKPFKVDVSPGYAIPGGTGSKAGALLAFEPKYAVADFISVGLRIEAVFVARGFSNFDNSSDIEVKAAGSYLLTGDYYFTDNYSFRPFAGAGTGLFLLGTASVDYDGNSSGASASSRFGGLFRMGFEAKHFRFGFEYNLVPATELENLDGGSETVTSKNSYIGIKLGVCIGGGLR